AAPRHRSEVASGLDRWPAADHGSRRARLPLREEVRRPRPQEEITDGARSRVPKASACGGLLLYFERSLGRAQVSRLCVLLERGLEQAELALDRIAARDLRRIRGRVHGGIEPANRGLQGFRAADQDAQALRHDLDVLLLARLVAGELHFRLFLLGLSD